jgi:hypothetical protein
MSTRKNKTSCPKIQRNHSTPWACRRVWFVKPSVAAALLRIGCYKANVRPSTAFAVDEINFGFTGDEAEFVGAK